MIKIHIIQLSDTLKEIINKQTKCDIFSSIKKNKVVKLRIKDVRTKPIETELTTPLSKGQKLAKWCVKNIHFALTVLLGLSGEASGMKDEIIAKDTRMKWQRSEPIMLNVKLRSSNNWNRTQRQHLRSLSLC